MLDVELWHLLQSGWLELLFFWLPLLIFLGSLTYLVYKDPRRPAIGREASAWQAWAGKHLLRAVWMSNERYPDRRFNVLLQDYLYLSAIQIIALSSFAVFRSWRGVDIHFQGRLTTYLALYLAFVLLAALTTAWDRVRDREPREQGGWRDQARSLARALGRRVGAVVTNYVNFSHRIYIKINLGKDDIEEIDILRLISRSIYSKYLEFRKFGLTDLWWRFLYALVLYFTVGLIYYLQPIYQLNNSFEDALHTYAYLPSQLVGLQGVEPGDFEVVLRCLSASDELDLPTFWTTFAHRVTGTPPGADHQPSGSAPPGTGEESRSERGPSWIVRRGGHASVPDSDGAAIGRSPRPSLRDQLRRSLGLLHLSGRPGEPSPPLQPVSPRRPAGSRAPCWRRCTSTRGSVCCRSFPTTPSSSTSSSPGSGSTHSPRGGRSGSSPTTPSSGSSGC